MYMWLCRDRCCRQRSNAQNIQKTRVIIIVKLIRVHKTQALCDFFSYFSSSYSIFSYNFFISKNFLIIHKLGHTHSGSQVRGINGRENSNSVRGYKKNLANLCSGKDIIYKQIYVQMYVHTFGMQCGRRYSLESAVRVSSFSGCKICNNKMECTRIPTRIVYLQ